MHPVLVGSGPMQEPRCLHPRTAGIDSITYFVPNQSDITPWLHAMDVFVLPSLSEAFSNSPMEASGVWVHVRRVLLVAIRSRVREGETGLLFEPRDARGLAEAALASGRRADLRQRLAPAGTRQIHDHFRGAVGIRMDAIYAGGVRQVGDPCARPRLLTCGPPGPRSSRDCW
ncbi:MAG: glycosyltransferase family 4 protein [Gemmatimonadaceae bacterium]